MVFLSSPQKMTELFLHRVNPIYYSDYSDTLFTFRGRKLCFLSWNIIRAFSFAFLASNLEACWAKKDPSPKWQLIGVWLVSGRFYKGLNFNHFPCHTAVWNILDQKIQIINLPSWMLYPVWVLQSQIIIWWLQLWTIDFSCKENMFSL
jgi:hypothetical protein